MLFLIFKHLDKISKILSLRICIKNSEQKCTSEKNEKNFNNCNTIYSESLKHLNTH